MKNRVVRATALVFILSLIAKCIGFVKSIVQASYFGATMYTDAYNVANGFVSNILYMFTTAIAVAFVPLYIQQKNINRNEKQFATKTITVLFILSIFLTVILVIIAPLIVWVIAPSYSGDIQILTVKYFRVLVLGFSFSFVANMYTNLLNAEKVYGFSAFSSVINSVILLLFIILLSDYLGIWALVLAIPVSYLAQWIILYSKGKKFAKISFYYGIKDDGIRILARQALPILLAQATVEINQVVDRALLSSVNTGALTAVAYSAVLYQFATTLISTPLSTVMFTELSEAGACNDSTAMKEILNKCYKVLLLVCVPIISVMFFCSTDIVVIVYGHGNYSADSVLMTAEGLEMYGLCLLPVCIKTVLSRAYYAMNDTKRPMAMSVLEVCINIILSIIMVRFWGIYGVVGATAIASILFIIIMLINFNCRYIKVLTAPILFEYWKIVLSSIIVVVMMFWIKNSYWCNSLADFIVKTIISFGVYLGLLFFLREKLLLIGIKSFISKIKKQNPGDG